MSPAATITIPRRFNGPQESGNGGTPAASSPATWTDRSRSACAARCRWTSRSSSAAREDSFGVFAGQVEGRELVATPWSPPAWTAGDDGKVRPEFVWAALDCPTYFACHLEGELTLSMLVRQRAEVLAPPSAGEEHVVIAWPIEQEGRKRLAGAAVLSTGGETWPWPRR